MCILSCKKIVFNVILLHVDVGLHADRNLFEENNSSVHCYEQLMNTDGYMKRHLVLNLQWLPKCCRRILPLEITPRKILPRKITPEKFPPEKKKTENILLGKLPLPS